MINVNGTPFDFITERLIRTGVVSEHPQKKQAGEGYDHPFLLKTNHDNEIVLKDSESGRTLTIETDAEGEIVGVPSRKYLGICLETQGLPDSIHHAHFPSWILAKDKEYSSKTVYKFETLEK
jgi:aldose 1-epimerase